MFKKIFVCVIVAFSISSIFSEAYSQAEGENSFRLAALNNRFLTSPDTISCTAGRGIYVAANPDLDGDGKPEILVTEYRDGGRILVFEVVGDNTLEYVWGSKKLNPGGFGGGSTPRSVTVGDFDNNGKMEIIFQVGYSATDSLSRAQRGLYFYEYTGNDNDYGAEPAFKLKFDEIDPLFDALSVGRAENPLTVQDIDGDGKNELLYTPRVFDSTLETGNLYILEVESGTFTGGDASIRLEYKYTGMAKAIDFGDDGYTPVNTAVGDIDNDGFAEIVVLGWTNTNSGAGVGFLEVSGVDTYTDGSVVPISETSIFNVKADIEIVNVDGNVAVIFAAGWSNQGIQRIYVMDNIVNDAFVSESDLHIISEGVEQFGIMAIGDQDHGSGSDGFDIYVSTVPEIINIEYNGSGALSDPASYTNHGRLGQFNLDEAYDLSDGLFNSIYTYPGMDLDNDGNRDLVVGYKGACGPEGDILEGELFTVNTYGIFVFEWGDSTQSIPVTLSTGVEDEAPPAWIVITPKDYILEQNYPNPFNPTTNITFTLPLENRISLKIYNSLGQEVKTLIDNQEYSRGPHSVIWDATDKNGNPVTSGVYVYKLVFGNFSKTKTMSLVR
ncbi:T9SS type A sorting domain-containing protein [candidate division KSB1 bacterium]|nr:T9SS type A sorting domain-containing protein [candidate division KSB1 bacterium]